MINIEEKLKNRLGSPAERTAPKVTNLSKPPSGKSKKFSFVTSAEFHTAYKTYAASKGKTMSDVLIESFELYKKQNM